MRCAACPTPLTPSRAVLVVRRCRMCACTRVQRQRCALVLLRALPVPCSCTMRGWLMLCP